MPMLRRARARGRRRKLDARLTLVRSDIRALPFAPGSFEIVIAPYGVLQSMSGPEDLAAALRAAAHVIAPGGVFWIDIAVEVASWPEYRNRVRWRQRPDAPRDATLIESVRQDRARRLTVFRQQYTQRRRRRTITRDFDLCFYTPSVRQLHAMLRRAGFHVDGTTDYAGLAWQKGSDSLVVRATRV
jgi:SAM-dependent methyltransferase